jgi:hypothetical protein
MTNYFPVQKPGLVTTIAVTTLVSGIINLFWGLVASVTALGTIVGVVCLPLTIMPTILGVFEIIYAAKLLSTSPQPLRPSQSIAILEILCILIGNGFSMIVGILSLVFYNDIVVKDYFARLTGTPMPVTVTPAPIEPPAALPLAEPAPVSPEPILSPEAESPAPEPIEKKPRTRKVARGK